MMNKSAVLLVQPPQIQKIGWSRYLDKKKRVDGSQKITIILFLNFEKLLHVTKFIMI
jgi:hypothetical protein